MNEEELNEEELNEEESFVPDPSQGVAAPDYTLEQGLLTKGRSLLGVVQSGLARSIYTKISKIDGVQEMITKAQEQLPSISQKGVQEFKTKAANRIQEIMRKLAESSFDPQTLRDAINKDQSGGLGGGGGVPGDDDDEEEEEEPLDVEAELKKYYEEQDLKLKPDSPEDIIISGAKVRARRVTDRDVKDLLLKYPNLDLAKANRYVDLNARKITDVARTIEFLNDVYADNSLNVDTATLEDVAAEFSVVFGVDAKPEDLQKIIDERGEITFTTARRKAEGKPPYIIKDLDDLITVYFERLNVLKKANVFDEGHIFAVNSLLRDKNVSNLATYGSNIEPEIARSIEQLIDKQTLEELIAPGQGPAYLEKVVQGNRSRKDTVDPDKAVARVFGGAYGVEEDFLNFMFPERTVDAKVPPELKDTFVDLYNKELAALLQNFPESKPGQGGLQIGQYTLERLKEQVQNLVAEEMNLARGLNDALNETEYQRIKKENPEILLYLDERFGGKEQYVIPDKKARRIRRKGIDTKGLDEFRVGSSWDIGE